MVDFGNDWNEILAGEFEADYYREMRKVLVAEYRSRLIYPHMNDIFNAFKLTPYSSVKAVILGQDPYHGAGQAHGLSFSVKRGVAIPPSLANIFTELQNDLKIKPPAHGDLTSWAKEGVLLLNSILTVRAGEAGSHANIGWQAFTDNVIKRLNERGSPIVFFLWGQKAYSKHIFITNPMHTYLKAAHPSPYSARGFMGCGHFSKCNHILETNGMKPLSWELD